MKIEKNIFWDIFILISGKEGFEFTEI